MDQDHELLIEIRDELSRYFRRTGKYTITEPLLMAEIRRLFNKVYDSSIEVIYRKRGLSKEDALQDSIMYLLEERGGVAAGHIHTVYFDYYDRNMSRHEPYTLAHSRKSLKIIIRQGLLKRTNRSIADNVVRRALQLLQAEPYRTHFEGGARRFSFSHENVQQLDQLPSQEALKRAIRFASNVSKIPQSDAAERVNKVFHTPDLHLALQIILENAHGLTIAQLHNVFEGLLTDRPTANVFTHEDMNALTESKTELETIGAETAALVRQVAREIWENTDWGTKTILSCQFSGLPDQKIAESISFDVADPARRRSRAWVTTKFTDFGERVSKEIAGLSADDQMRVSRLLEAHILNFDSEVGQ